MEASTPGRAPRGLAPEASRLLSALEGFDLDRVWTPPRPPRAPPRPPGWPWLLVAALLAGAIVLGRRRALSVALLSFGSGVLAIAASLWWHSPAIASLWLALPVLVIGLFAAVARRAPRDLLFLVAIAAASALLSLLEVDHVANWYTDYHELPDGACRAVVKSPGGPAFLFHLLAGLVPVGAWLVFAISRAAFALAVGLLALTLRRAAASGGGPLPPWTHHLFVIFLLADGTLRGLGASDTPHTLCLLAFSLGLIAYQELLTLEGGRRRALLMLALMLSSALVGLTRMEQLLMPLVFATLLLRPGDRGRLAAHLPPLVASLLGVVVAGVVSLDRGPGEHVAAGVTAASLGWPTIELLPLFPSPVALAALVAFALACLRRPALALLLVGVVGFEGLLVLGGFGLGHLGGTDPVQRYLFIVIPIVLLIFAVGVAGLIEEVRRLEGRRLWVALSAALVLALGWLGAALSTSRDETPWIYQAEYAFLSRQLPRLPEGATIAAVWMSGLDRGVRGLEGPLSIPQALLVIDRRDLRWVVVEPGAPTPRSARFFYRGATCQLSPELLRASPSERGRRLLEEQLRLCRRLSARVEAWIAVERVRGRPMVPGLAEGELELSLGRLSADEVP